MGALVSLQKQIAATMKAHGMGTHGMGGRIGVAVSGGADSVFLLHALAEAGLAAAVLHVNHKLRGEESDRDEAFVRGLGERFGLPVHVAVLPPGEGNLEQEARRARYAFFGERIAAGVCDSVATGHTKDDQAETVLGRFLRGAGTAGLSGILPVTGAGIIRPLIDVGRAEIRAALREAGITWQEDCSNLNTAFLRNRIRHEIMPQLATLNPALSDTLASTAGWAQGEEDYWRGEIGRLESELVVQSGDAVLIRTGDLRQLPVAVERRLIRRLVERVRGSLRSIDFRHGEAIRALVAANEGSGRLQLPDLDIYRSFDWLRMAPVGFDTRLERNFEAAIGVPGVIEAPERGIRIELDDSNGVYNDVVNALDREKCADAPGLPHLVLRNWRPGDRYLPASRAKAGAPEKIKTFFQESRVPLWDRRNWPVIVRRNDRGESIVWSRRFGVAEEFAVTSETRRILMVREVPEQTGESNLTVGTSIQTDGERVKSDAAFRKEAL